MKKEMPRKTGLQRFLAVLFVLGIIAGSLGLGEKIYYDRTLDAVTEEGIIRNAALAEHPLNRTLSEQEIKDYVKEFAPAIIRQDEAGLKAFIRKSLDLVIRNSADDFRAYYMRDEAKYRERLDQAAEKALADEEFMGGLQEFAASFRNKLGILWHLLKIVWYSGEITIAGFALAGLSLLLWFLCGGVSAGPVRGGLVPALLVSIACAGAILFLALKMPPANLQGLDIGSFIAEYF